MTGAILVATGVKKFYPGVAALSGVSLELMPGEIHAVMGENGSGKSTLLSIISGAQEPDAGTFLVDGVPHECFTPKLARSLGIALVHQEPQLAGALTVGENMMMGRLPGRTPFVGMRSINRAAQRILDDLGLAIAAGALVSSLSTGRRQLVEIAKGLVDKPRVLLLDEATSSLDDDDVATLFALLHRLKADGVAIAFISHRMKEVMDLADRVTVLRDGHYVDTVETSAVDEHRLVAMMVGRDLADYWHKVHVETGEPVLVVDQVSRGFLKEISLTVNRGEIVGIAGLVGSGRSALMRTLAGVKPAKTGAITVHGRSVHIRSPREAHRLGLGYVPEDRKAEGLVMGWSILRNAALSVMNDRGALAFLGGGFDRAALERGSRGLKIKASSPSQRVSQLSGGNQQKVVIARELATKPSILLLDEPTRGVDVGAKEDIYAEISALVEGGMSLLIASSELQELLGVCDRIYVMFHGRIVAELDAADATEESITYSSSGAHELSTAPAPLTAAIPAEKD